MNKKTTIKGSVADACVKAYNKTLSQITKVKSSIFAQFRDLASDHEQALRLALNEAEALAMQSGFPQLVFQDLAEEKARGIATWAAHQRAVQTASFFRSTVPDRRA
jgi:hypothetical protein